LKCDIHQFFPSVNHAVLKQIVRRTIRDKKILRVIDLIIDSYNSGTTGKGIPIGSLTSQLFANCYLDPLDHYLKETCRIKYYARYMDDFMILHKDKTYLGKLKKEIEQFVRENLAVSMNPKTGIFHERQGIDFCGYRVWPTHVLPRKSTVKRAKKRLKRFMKVYRERPGILKHAADSIQSFLGYIKHCAGYTTTKELLSSIIFSHTIRRDL
ncbi:MAG: RNA-directed DNA polymerase, partial [Dysgonamonadaceae bacterium]|nr:RNA-directed DNA polymerase [Dysgonamonadaceae bacterium]